MKKLLDEMKAAGLNVMGGINWVWVDGIETEVEADLWHQRILSEGLETRGVYPPKGDEECYGIRFRAN